MKITSINNDLIKDVKGLYRKRERVKEKSFIIEGIKVVEEALDNDYVLKDIIYTEGLSQARGGDELLKRIESLPRRREVSEEVFEYISDTETPQGVLAVAELRFRDISEVGRDGKETLIFLDGLQDPGNMGTIIRTADAFNIDGIIIGAGTVDPYNPKVIRATMGSIFRVPIYYLDQVEEELQGLKDLGFRILSTSLDDSTDIKDVDFNKSIITIGNESRGVSQDIFHISDEFIKIPMPGKSESLNAGVAASIIMYEVSK